MGNNELLAVSAISLDEVEANKISKSQKIETPKTITSRKIGNITYQVVSSHSPTATETAKDKIGGLILRECSRLLKH